MTHSLCRNEKKTFFFPSRKTRLGARARRGETGDGDDDDDGDLDRASAVAFVEYDDDDETIIEVSKRWSDASATAPTFCFVSKRRKRPS